MGKNLSEAGCIIPILLIIVYGLLIISNIPFSIFWILPIVICVISILFSVDYPSKGSTHYKTIKSNSVQAHQTRVSSNIVNNSVKTHAPSSSTNISKPVKLAEPQAFFCHDCGTQIEPDSLFCHQCGSSAKSYTLSSSTKMAKPKALFCYFCGTRIEPNAFFCSQCGSKLE
ncbi:MAG: zinc ribbon domain-containing protein [Candidatus Hermodarchaeota archaeon]